MANFVEQFSEDESGAVTVEFIVLAAGIVGLAIAAFSVVETESQTLANNAPQFRRFDPLIWCDGPGNR